MQRSSFTALASVLALASSLCAPGIVHAQTTYTLTQVGVNDGTTISSVTGIDDEGGLGLTVATGPTVNVYLWRQGTQVNIGGLTPSPQFVESGGENDLMQIVGTTICPTSGNFCGFVWRQGHMTELPSPAGSSAVFGIQLNVLGQIVGQAYDANSNTAQAVLWSQGKLILLPGISGGTFSQPVGINIRGEIVGYANDAANVPNTVVWKQGALTVLIKNAIPSAINDEGQIVGTTLASSTPFLWQNGMMTQLPTIPGMSATGTAHAINDLGQIVGSLGSSLAVLWQNGVAVALNGQVAKNDPLQPYVLLEAGILINNLGQIVANGIDTRNPAIGQQYLLTPVR